MMQCTDHVHDTSSPSKLVAVIVLSWNNYADLSKCLESVLNSDVHGFSLKVIVVDNGSTDDLCSRLKREYSSVTVLCTGVNLGFARGNNVGIKHALGLGADYVVLLNQDVFVSSQYIQTLVEFMEKNPYVGIAGGKVLFADRPKVIWSAGGRINWWLGRFGGHGYKQVDSQGKYTTIREVDYIPGAAMIIRRELLEAIGLLPECYFLGGEEVDFAVRARKAKFKVCYVPSPEAYVWHRVGYSGRFDPAMVYNRFRNTFLFLERNLPRPLWWAWQLASWIYVTIFWDALTCLRKGERRRVHKLLYMLALKDHRRYKMVAAEHLDVIRNQIAVAELSLKSS